MVKTALVTGAHGFVGRHVAKHLSSHEWKVAGLGHGIWASSDERVHWGLSSWHEGDVTIETLLGCKIVPDAIIHCAGSGSVGFSQKHPREDFERSVGSTLEVLEYARLHAPEAKIVLISSAAVYGVAEHVPIGEADTLAPISPYGVHKKIAEELCLSYSRYFGTSVTILRLFSVYGAGLKKQLLWDACNKIVRGEASFFGTGNELRDWIHIADVCTLVETVLRHAEKSSCRILNGGSGAGVSVREVLAQLIGGLASNVSPVFMGVEKEGDPSRYVADIAQAGALGWQPQVDLHAGLAEYARWFAEGGK